MSHSIFNFQVSLFFIIMASFIIIIMAIWPTDWRGPFDQNKSKHNINWRNFATILLFSLSGVFKFITIKIYPICAMFRLILIRRISQIRWYNYSDSQVKKIKNFNFCNWLIRHRACSVPLKCLTMFIRYVFSLSLSRAAKFELGTVPGIKSLPISR